MAAKHSIEHDNGITSISFSQKPSYAELQRAIDGIVEKYPYEYRLWDLSNIYVDLSMKEILDIADYGKDKFAKPNKAAFVAPRIWRMG